MSSTNGASVTPLADLLKQATAEDHAAAENQAFQRSLVRGEVSRPAFAAFQSGMLELLSALHSRLPQESGEWSAFRRAAAAHASRLAQDLEGLSDGEAPKPSAAVAAFVERLGGAEWSAGTALGAFYVVEGSMNGNRFIRRALEAARPEFAGNLRYFDPYGSRQRECWQQARSGIDRVGETLPTPDDALRAAHETFTLSAALGAEVEEQNQAEAA